MKCIHNSFVEIVVMCLHSKLPGYRDPQSAVSGGHSSYENGVLHALQLNDIHVRYPAYLYRLAAVNILWPGGKQLL